jgi:hypothetical protein
VAGDAGIQVKDELPISINFGNGKPVYVSLRKSGRWARIWGRLRRKPAPDYYNSEVAFAPIRTETIRSITLMLPDGRVIDVPVHAGEPQWDQLPSPRTFVPLSMEDGE